MKVTRFDRRRDLIIVPGRVLGPNGTPHELRFAFDTGAAETVIDAGEEAEETR